MQQERGRASRACANRAGSPLPSRQQCRQLTYRLATWERSSSQTPKHKPDASQACSTLAAAAQPGQESTKRGAGRKQGVYRHQQRRKSSAVCYKEACSAPGR